MGIDCNYTGMLDPIIISYELATNVYGYLLEYWQYPVGTTYNSSQNSDPN